MSSDSPPNTVPPSGVSAFRAALTRWWKGKITPTHDLSWYLKWTATVLIVSAMATRSLAPDPLIDFSLSLVGTLLWLIVGLLWRDRALIVLNIIITGFASIGLWKAIFGV